MDELKELAEKINACKRCELWKERKNTVPGEGSAESKLMFIGEAPGNREDELGEPFCGKSGEFLDELFAIAKIRRDSVFITSVIKCRPPNNRVPKTDEIRACRTYLDKQIELVNPKIIVLLGETALNTLLGMKGISSQHGKVIKKDRIYIPMFHPSAGMRFPKIRKEMERDFAALMEIL